MQCKRIQESISLNEELSVSARQHVATCSECERHVSRVQAMAIELGALRTAAPAGLRESIRSEMGRSKPRPNLTHALVAASIIALMAVPIYPFVASRLHRKPDAIGNWPTYHMHEQRFNAKAQLSYTSDVWFDKDAARFTGLFNTGVDRDYVLRLESGQEWIYEFDPAGTLSRKPAPRDACVPMSDDLRSLLSGDRRSFNQAAITEEPSRVLNINGRTLDVSETRIAKANGESQIVFYKDHKTGRIAEVQHFGATYVRTKGHVVLRATPEYIDTFDYVAVARAKFDPSTLAKPVQSAAAKHG